MRANQTDKCQELLIFQYLAQLGISLEENFIYPLLHNFRFQGHNGQHVCLMFPVAGPPISEMIDTLMIPTKEERATLARLFG